MSINPDRLFPVDFDKLYRDFKKAVAAARQLQSPNAEDTLEIKCAVVGFCYNSPAEKWDISHYDLVFRELSQENGMTPNERLFFALVLGYALGLYQRGSIDFAQVELAEAQSFGFISVKGGQF